VLTITEIFELVFLFVAIWFSQRRLKKVNDDIEIQAKNEQEGNKSSVQLTNNVVKQKDTSFN
jgi:hypothetical protein